MELRRRSSDSSAWSRPAIDIQALSKQAQTVFHGVFAVEEFKFNASRQSGFQLWGQRSRDREGRCVSCWLAHQMRGCCGTLAAPNYNQTAANTRGHSEGGSSQAHQSRGRGQECGEAAGGAPATLGARPLRFTPTPRCDHDSPALLLPHQLVGWKLQGGRGNHVCQHDRTHEEMSRSPRLRRGRCVRLDRRTSWQRPSSVSAVWWGEGGRTGGGGLKEDWNLQPPGPELECVPVLFFKDVAVEGESAWTPHALLIMLHHWSLIKSASAISFSADASRLHREKPGSAALSRKVNFFAVKLMQVQELSYALLGFVLFFFFKKTSQK